MPRHIIVNVDSKRVWFETYDLRSMFSGLRSQ